MTTTTTKSTLLEGVVTSTKMDKTAVVSVNRFVQHPKYGKFIKRSKKFKAHDPENRCQVGQKVTIRSCRPLSKDKHFEIVY